MGTTRLLGVRVALAAALLLAVVMLVLSAASADAAFPGQNGKIAFSKENFRQGTSGIFAIDPDGGGQQRLTSGYGYSPSWSDDGERVVFVGSSGEGEMEFNEDIYVMDADGANKRQITDTPRAFEYGADWQPLVP